MTNNNPTNHPCNDNNNNNNNNTNITQIPVEIVSEEEMSLIESAFFAATRPLVSLSNSRSFGSVSKRALPILVGSSSGSVSGSGCDDVEDLGGLRSPEISKRKKCKVPGSLLGRFRKNKGLYVTDITSTEWCEKQMEFSLIFGKPEITSAMKAGIARHAKLEEEVTKKVEVHVESREDIWALKFMNFIICANQLLFEGLTRELPVVGLIQGVWMIGVIDELRMPMTGDGRILTLVDTKTRGQPRLPTEPQCRTGRLQLMCYKYLWDNLVSNKFPTEEFYDFFSLDSQHILSNDIKKTTAESGLPAETLGEVLKYYSNTCSTLPQAHEQLLLRYELQEDNSLIGEDEFTYDNEWLKGKVQSCLEFWQGEREPKYVPEKEQWKCRYCQFASVCPAQSEATSQSSSQSN